MGILVFHLSIAKLHEPFDGKYEKHFEGNPEYIQQSRNDWKGVQTYPGILAGKRSIKNVDVISGATWSFNIFSATVVDALKNSR
jgi:major membrane immunogen (membrane-anchored lipoprotein)